MKHMFLEVLSAERKKGKKEEKRLCGCTERAVFSILTCNFFFDAMVAHWLEIQSDGMNLGWPRSIPGLFLLCSLFLAGMLWRCW